MTHLSFCKLFLVWTLVTATAFATSFARAATRSKTSVAASKSGPLGLENAECEHINLKVPINSQNVVNTNVDDNYSNQTYVSDILLQLTGRPAEFAAEHLPGTTQPFSRVLRIAAWHCQPRRSAKTDSSLIVGVPGVGFDHNYWDFPYKPEYSFVKQAASYGYSTLIYDRLGTGQSEAPSKGGFSVVQASTDVAILREILTQVRQGTLTGLAKQGYKRTVLLGHGYGSALSEAITRDAPELVDGVVLTGYSNNGSYVDNAIQTGSFTIANQIKDLVQLRDKPSIYVATGSPTSFLLFFFQPFAYDQEAFEIARRTEQPTTLGVFSTFNLITGVATRFNGPVLVIDGDRDFPFCGTDCSSTIPPIPEGVRALYPDARSFTSIIVPNTGHAVVPHRTGPQHNVDILQWIISQGL